MQTGRERHADDGAVARRPRLRRVVAADEAIARSSRRDILAGILERSGMDVRGIMAALELSAPPPPPHQSASGLRVAGGAA